MSACTEGVAVAVSASTGAGPRLAARQILAQHPVVWPEVVPPLRNAMRLVDGDQRQLALGQHLAKARHPQPLRRNEKELQAALQVVHASLPRHAAIQPGVNARHPQPQRRPAWPPGLPSAQSAERSPAPCRPAQSPATGSRALARPRRHHQQQVAPLNRRPAHRLLARPEFGKPKHPLTVPKSIPSRTQRAPRSSHSCQLQLYRSALFQRDNSPRHFG
jgi:hypothetical protein